MFDYLQQFNSLAKDLRDRVSSPSALATISELENKYRVDLAMVVMKLMIKSLTPANLPSYFISETGLAAEAAAALARELKEKVLAPVADYLGLAAEKRAWDLDKDIEMFIKEAGLVLPSAVLVGRFKNILATYLRGVRSKIDTRNSLAKDAKVGGLNLSDAEISRVLKVCESHHFTNLELKSAAAPAIPAAPAKPAVTRLDKIMAAADKGGEYDLKRSLAQGGVQKNVTPSYLAKLDLKHELSAPVAQLDLPAAAKAPAPKVTTPSAPVAKPAAPAKPLEPKLSASRLAPLRPATQAPAQPAAPVTAKPTPAAARPAPIASAARPRMHDIKPMPKVMGPVEELQFLDLVNFRRLGATPAEITAKILGKIKLLERDGYDKMVAGVRAWRQSPVNRLYLRLGQEAVAKGLPFKEAIAARQAAYQEYLNMAEVEAIVSLNSKLLF